MPERRSILPVLVLLLALAPAVATAQFPVNEGTPGSVIVFPKFVAGTTDAGEPNSQFEISVGCPVLNGVGACFFPDGTKIKLQARWVCPGSPDTFTCQAAGFELNTTVFGTVVFNPANAGPSIQQVPAPPCPKGYLIAWVVSATNGPTNGQPIKFDGLLGDALIRDARGAVSAYHAIPVQADPALATFALVALGIPPALPFTGNPGQYARVPSTVQASLRFDATETASSPAVTTNLVLLTLDVLTNQPTSVASSGGGRVARDAQGLDRRGALRSEAFAYAYSYLMIRDLVSTPAHFVP